MRLKIRRAALRDTPDVIGAGFYAVAEVDGEVIAALVVDPERLRAAGFPATWRVPPAVPPSAGAGGK